MTFGAGFPARPSSGPAFLDEPPGGDDFTDYDSLHVETYMRLLDAAASGANRLQTARAIFGIDPVLEPERAEKVLSSHLARAQWLSVHGFRNLIPSRRP